MGQSVGGDSNQDEDEQEDIQEEQTAVGHFGADGSGK